jgi:dihydrofolate synthase / folylpolyglutamate synthase
VRAVSQAQAQGDDRARPRYAALLARLEGVRALGVDFGLDRVRAALAQLGDPQRRFAAVQIAGTNGKGSTAAMAEAIFRAAGLRTGLYTSPHLSRFTERIRIAGVEVDGDVLAALDARVAATGVPLTYFEIATVLAFLVFADAGVEMAVLETGLGGRLDAVTTCEPAATAVTTIAFDHAEYLGTTLPAIAREKAGIIKPGVPHLVGALDPEADAEMALAAAAAGAPLLRYGRDFGDPPVAPALAGPHQRVNAALAVALAARAFARVGRGVLPAGALEAGLATARWPGRLERIADVVLDCAHNVEGARALAAAVPALSGGRTPVLVISVVRDKDAAGILAALTPGMAAVVATRSPSPRALPAADLAALARAFIRDVNAVDDPVTALAAARSLAGPEGLVVVAGSIFLVAAIRAHLLGDRVDPTATSDPL